MSPRQARENKGGYFLRNNTPSLPMASVYSHVHIQSHIHTHYFLNLFKYTHTHIPYSFPFLQFPFPPSSSLPPLLPVLPLTPLPVYFPSSLLRKMQASHVYSQPWHSNLQQDQVPSLSLRIDKAAQQEEKVPKAGNRVRNSPAPFVRFPQFVFPLST